MPDQEDLETYHGYSVDSENQPQTGGVSNVDGRGLVEPLEEGYSPPERLSGADRWGTTAREESAGESLDERLRQEEPEPDSDAPYAEVTREVGGARAGRLVEDDAGARTDTDSDMYATDVGIDGAGASAEEAAVRIIDANNPGEP
jgi:hypothetical protein